MNVLITSPTTHNWQAFATWFSIREKIPEANVVIAITYTKEVVFQLYQWVKKLKIKHFFHSNQFSNPISNNLALTKIANEKKFLTKNQPVLIMSERCMLLSPNIEQKIAYDSNAIFLPKIEEIDELINEIELNNLNVGNPLSVEVKESKILHPIVSYKKGCGRWIDKLKGCPFSNAAGLALEEMTENEHQVINLWKRMAPLYQATA